MVKGILVEFATPEALTMATRRLKALGYKRLDAFTPYPVKEVIEELTPRSPIAAIMLIAGLSGAALAYVIQYWCNGVDYPINVGGRPLNSAPAFIPITFETAVLSASVIGFVALLALCRLPRLYSPVFEIPGFDRVTTDRFWLAIDESDEVFDPKVQDELAQLGAVRFELLQTRPA
jgi:hypothetical protein